MGFLDSVKNEDTNIPTPTAYLDSKASQAFTANVLDVRIHKSQNKKNKNTFGREFFLIELEVISGEANLADRQAEPGEVVTYSKKLPLIAGSTDSGYVLAEMADMICGCTGKQRSSFRGEAEAVAAKIMEALAEGCGGGKVFVGTTDPNEGGWRLPTFTLVDEDQASKKGKKAA